MARDSNVSSRAGESHDPRDDNREQRRPGAHA